MMLHRKYIISIAIPCVIAAFVYVPQFFISNEDNSYTQALNPNIIKGYNEFISNNETLDFDKDGLNNKKELEIGSDLYNPDTDNDGLSDYYEYNYDTNILKNDEWLCKQMTNTLKKENRTYKNPYSSNGIILWADSIESRTYGTVILSRAGNDISYVFDKFSGYAQFPDESIPYDISSGVHVKLERNADTGLYRIEDGMKVILSDIEYDYIYKFEIFGKPMYKNSSLLSKVLDILLPEKGFITCRKTATIDTEYKKNNDVILYPIPTADKDYNYNDYSRFNCNQNRLEDLANVYRNIDNGYSVCVSLIDEEGETLGVIYGYDQYGNLYIADISTGQELGTLKIHEHYTKLYTSEDFFEDYYWYSFAGLGYDSQNKARISFYSSSINTEK